MPLPYELTMVAAYMGDERVIGFQGDMPWPRLETDREVFRARTHAAVVIMGRVTWEAILRNNGHPLVGRTNIVLSHGDGESFTGATPAFSVEDALGVVERVRGDNQKVFVIGGSQIYRAFLPWARRIFLSRIETQDGRIPAGDAFFPEFEDQFVLRRAKSSGPERGYSVILEDYRRI